MLLVLVRTALAVHTTAAPYSPCSVIVSTLCCGHSRLRHTVDRLQNARNDLIGVAFGVRAAIFQIALVTVLDELDGHADRSATIRETIAELVNGLRFVQTGQAQMVVRAIHSDMLGDVFFERL